MNDASVNFVLLMCLFPRNGTISIAKSTTFIYLILVSRNFVLVYTSNKFQFLESLECIIPFVKHC